MVFVKAWFRKGEAELVGCIMPDAHYLALPKRLSWRLRYSVIITTSRWCTGKSDANLFPSHRRHK